MIGPRSSRERIAIGFDAAPADDDDGVRTELGNGVVLIGFSEGNKAEVHALWCSDAKIGTLHPARVLAGRASKFLLGLDPAQATAEVVGILTILAIGHERSISDHDMLERPHRRKLSVHWLALGEERHIETGFHAEKA